MADEAEVNFQLGATRYQAGDYRGALAHFLASDRLAPNHNVRFNIARSFQRLGQYAEAYRWCESALSGQVDPSLRAQLEETRQAIIREVAVVELSSEPAGATVYLDRTDLGSVAVTPARIAVSPGTHQVLLRREGYEPTQSETLQFAKGSTVSLTFSLRRIVGAVSVEADAPTKVTTEVGDEAFGCTAACVLELPPGSHTLRFQREGFRTPPAQVSVRPEQRSRVRVEATPVTGAILVTSVERDVLIEVDGVAMGFTPTVVRNVPLGERVVRLSLTGFEPVEHRVFVQEDEQAQLLDVVLPATREVTAAAREEQSIEEAPASVSVISAQEIKAFRYPTIYEALRGQRGVTLSNDGAYAGVGLRGLGQPGDYGNRILVLSDGATLNDNILWQSYVGYDGRVDLGEVGGIELVRGPGSVLYGTGAVSGVVNLMPRSRPERAAVELEAGAQDASTARGRLSGAIPLGKKGGLRLSASAARSGGEDALIPTQPLSPITGLRSFDAATGTARGTYGPFTLQALLTTRKQQVPNGAYGAEIGEKPNNLQDTRGMVELRFEPRLGRRTQLFTRGFANVYNFEAKQTYADESSSRFVADERYKGRWFGAEARATFALTSQLKLTVGGEVSASTRASLRGANLIGASREPYLHEDKSYQIYAGYGLVDWQLMRWLKISAGGRVDSWSTFGATVNPRMALIFKLSERDTLKLMGGRAFRAPSIYELRYNDGGNTQVASDYMGYKLKPELVWSAELELTHRFSDGWSLVTAGHFQYADDLIGQSGNPIVRYTNSANSLYAIGGDAEVRREFAAGWMVGASYTYLFARYTGESAGSDRSLVPNVPAHGASARGVVPLGAGFRLAMRATVEAPRLIREVDAETPARLTDTAVISDLVLSGEASRYGLDYALGLYNLFDWRLALPTDTTFLTWTMPQPGRTLLATVSLRL